jgi:hypothetical protein
LGAPANSSTYEASCKTVEYPSNKHWRTRADNGTASTYRPKKKKAPRWAGPSHLPAIFCAPARALAARFGKVGIMGAARVRRVARLRAVGEPGENIGERRVGAELVNQRRPPVAPLAVASVTGDADHVAREVGEREGATSRVVGHALGLQCPACKDMRSAVAARRCLTLRCAPPHRPNRRLAPISPLTDSCPKRAGQRGRRALQCEAAFRPPPNAKTPLAEPSRQSLLRRLHPRHLARLCRCRPRACSLRPLRTATFWQVVASLICPEHQGMSARMTVRRVIIDAILYSVFVAELMSAAVRLAIG